MTDPAVIDPVENTTSARVGRPFAPEWDAVCRHYAALLGAAGIDPESDEPADAHTRGCPRARSAREDTMLQAERAARAGSAHAAAHTAAEFRQAAAYREILAIAHGRHALPLADDPAAPVRRPGRWSTRARGQFAAEDPWWHDHVAAATAAKAADPVAARDEQNGRWDAGNVRAQRDAGNRHAALNSALQRRAREAAAKQKRGRAK